MNVWSCMCVGKVQCIGKRTSHSWYNSSSSTVAAVGYLVFEVAKCEHLLFLPYFGVNHVVYSILHAFLSSFNSLSSSVADPAVFY